MTVRADHQQIRLIFFYDPYDFPGPAIKAKHTACFNIFFGQLCHIFFQLFLVALRFQVMRIMFHQAGGCAFHDMYQ